MHPVFFDKNGSNNTNKLSPQEPSNPHLNNPLCSNNTNKLSPQEQVQNHMLKKLVQIIQINLVLKNLLLRFNNAIPFK